jgi:hypothetical protein
MLSSFFASPSGLVSPTRVAAIFEVTPITYKYVEFVLRFPIWFGKPGYGWHFLK